MNTCGTELPLKTNREMVEHLRKMNGTMYMFTSDFTDRLKQDRFTYKYLLGPNGELQKTNKTFGDPPYGIKLYKSSTYCIMSYAFADFALTHPKAIALRIYILKEQMLQKNTFMSRCIIFLKHPWVKPLFITFPPVPIGLSMILNVGCAMQ